MTNDEQWLLQEKYDGQKSEAFLADCARLDTGEPLAYVIGHMPFLDCTIWLDSKPLIPRSETEYWVAHAIAHITNRRSDLEADVRVLDLCAGSGAIGVAVAKASPHVRVDFAELDSTHLPTIQKNLHTNLLSSSSNLELGRQYRLYHSDLFTPYPNNDTSAATSVTTISSRSDLELGVYDFILSNPPYIDPALDRTEASVRDYEPSQALYGGSNGLALIAKIIATAPQHLTPAGELWLEHEPEQTKPIHELASAQQFAVITHQDQYHVERYSRLMLQ